MKSLWNRIGLCLLLLAPLAHGAKPTPEEIGNRYIAEAKARERITSGKASMAEIMQWVRAKTPKQDSDRIESFFGEIFAIACKRANAKEVAEFGRMLSQFPRDAYHFDACFSDYATASFGLSVARLKQNPVKLALPKPTTAPPQYLVTMPPEFTEAWTLWYSVNNAYEKLMREAQEAQKAGAIKQPRSMVLALRKLLPLPKRDAWKEISLFSWGHWCGTGMDELFHPRNRGILLSLLADGRTVEAVASALQQVCAPHLSTFGEYNMRFPQEVKDLLTVCGIDWELLFIGSMLPYEGPVPKRVALQKADQDMIGELSPWRQLASSGSPRALSLCMALIRSGRIDTAAGLDFISIATGVGKRAENSAHITGLVVPGFETLADTNPALVRGSHSRFPTPFREQPIPAELRSEAIALVASYLDPKVPAKQLAGTLSRIRENAVGDLREQLETLLKHPVYPIAAKARSLLAEAKLAAEDAPIVAPPPPLRFTVLTNGEPLANTKLDVRMEGVSMSSFETDAAGHLLVPLEEVVELEKLTKATISASSRSPRETIHLQRVVSEAAYQIPGFESTRRPPAVNPPPKADGKPDVWPGVWFNEEVEVQPGADREYTVAVKTAAMEFTFAPADAVDMTKHANIRILKGAGKNVYGYVELTAPLSDSVRIEGLQLRPYTVVVIGEGLETLVVSPLTVLAEGSQHRIELKPGRNVKGSIVSIEGYKSDLGFEGMLFKDGKRFEPAPSADTLGWMGLPLGKYRLRYLSSAETEARAKENGWPDPDIDPKSRHGGIDHAFELTEKSPILVDLGEFRLKPERPKK